MTTADRIHGALLGTLLGDAFGRPFEGIAPHDARLNEAIRARAAHPAAWDYSDDGEMALAVAESITRCGTVDEGHLLATLAARHEPARGYGKGMRAALRALRDTGDWRAAPHALWAEGSRGNGSAVRVAAVAAWHIAEDDRGVVSTAAARSAAPTHAHPDAVDATRAMALALWHLMRGAPPQGLRAWLMTGDPAFDRLLRSSRSPAGGPFAVDSVGLAVSALERGSGFTDAVQAAVAMGDDTDTNAAMTGALAGAAYGRHAIPDDWVGALPLKATARAAELASRLTRGTARPRGATPALGWRADYATIAASAGEDRVWVDTEGDAAWIVVADGAGGTGRGAEAASLVIRRVCETRPTSGRAMRDLLETVDRELAARASGLTTAVVVRLDGSRALGVAVGDSAAWALGHSGYRELTEHQSRRPLIGSGSASPMPFVLSRVEQVLVATDGLSAFVPPPELERLLEQRSKPGAFVDAARLPSGVLRDDTTVVIAARE